MKILHTSDWHLGQSFFTKSRKAEHQAFLHWLLAQAEQQKIEKWVSQQVAATKSKIATH